MQKVIKIRNLDCAACAAELSEELNSIDGVSNAVADFINQRVSLAYESDEAGLYRVVADRSPLMLVVVDRTHKRYAYVKQEIDLTGESPTFGVLFRLWQQGWIVEENGWRIVNSEEEPEPAPETAPEPVSAAAAGATRPTASETLPAAVRPAENQRP